MKVVMKFNVSFAEVLRGARGGVLESYQTNLRGGNRSETRYTRHLTIFAHPAPRTT